MCARICLIRCMHARTPNSSDSMRPKIIIFNAACNSWVRNVHACVHVCAPALHMRCQAEAMQCNANCNAHAMRCNRQTRNTAHACVAQALGVQRVQRLAILANRQCHAMGANRVAGSLKYLMKFAKYRVPKSLNTHSKMLQWPMQSGSRYFWWELVAKHICIAPGGLRFVLDGPDRILCRAVSEPSRQRPCMGLGATCLAQVGSHSI